MADRSITVRLKAVITEYQQAMQRASGETSAFAMAAKGQLATVGHQMTQLGDTMTKRVTLPLIGLSAAGVKVANDFESTFAQMVGLAGVPAEEIDRLRDSVLQLAQDTGKGPQELAEALYEAASAGLDANQALDAVTVAAQASAAGMGPTADIVGLVASATAAYGAEAINAAEATDILVATIRAGRANPQELAGTLGRVLPIASQLRIEFDEVGGAVAYLSNVFGDTNRTVTALQGFLVKLVSPSQQGREALEDMGTSVEELHAAIGRDGLQGALELLREHGFARNQQALRALFDDIEGFQGALALLNDNSGTLDETLSEVANSTGALQEAFSNWLGTDSAKTAKSFQEITVALIEFGGQIAPLVADLAQMAGTVAGLVGMFPDWLVQWGLLAAVMAGPATKSIGFLLRHLEDIKRVAGVMTSAVSRAFDAMALGAYSAAGAMGVVTAATAALTAGVGLLAFAWQQSAQRAAQHKRDLADIENAYWGASGALNFLTEETEQYILTQSRFHDRNQLDDLRRIGLDAEQVNRMLSEGTDGLQRFIDASQRGGEVTEVFKDAVGNFVDAAGNYVGTAGSAVEINGRWYQGNVDLIKSFEKEQQLIEENARSAITRALASSKLTDAQKDEIEATLEASDSTTKYTDVTLQFAEVLAAAGVVVGETGDAANQASAAYDNLGSSTAFAAETQRALAAALDASFNAMFGAAMMTAEIDSAFSSFNDTMGRTERSGGRAARSIDLVAEKQKALDSATRDAERAMEQWQRSVEDVERANRDLIKAQEELDELLRGPSERDKAKALHDQKRAALDLEEARQRLADAQEALTEAEDEGDPAKLAEARRDLERAELDLEAQTWRLEDATKTYNATAGWSAETDEKVRDARDRVTEAQKRLDKATQDTAKRFQELQDAQEAQRKVQDASLGSFAAADGALYNHRLNVIDTEGAYLRLAQAIKNVTAEILASNLSDPAASVDQINAIIARIKSNPFLTEEQKGQLLGFAYSAQATAIGFRPGFAGFMADGGVGTVTRPTMFVAGEAGAEDFAFVPKRKGGLATLMSLPPGMSAGSVAAGSDRSRGGVVIEHATFGDRRVVQDLDWWWRTQGAGV